VSIFSARNGNVSCYAMITRPAACFYSSSLGVSGSVSAFARRSRRERETNVSFSDAHNDTTPEQLTAALTNAKRSGNSDILSAVRAYVTGAEALAISRKNSAIVNVRRFTPSAQYSRNTGLKDAVKLCGSFARPWNSNAGLSYTNYHCLNFFSSSNVSTSSVIMYPSIDRDNGALMRGDLVPTGAFTIDFRVKPRRLVSNSFRAATLLHLSSCFAVSIVSGSLRDENGSIGAYRLMLQLSSSANIRPSDVNLSSLPQLTYLSQDNSLPRDVWNRVIIRWGAAASKMTGSAIVGSGSFSFALASSSVAPSSATPQPYVMCVGNYYEGSNSGSSSQAYFFSTDTSTRDGLVNLSSDVGGIEEPASSRFSHPMNGEVHDLAYYERWLTDAEITSSATYGHSVVPADCYLYLAPFFTRESPFRATAGDHGGVLLTPFQEFDGTTSSPLNAELALGVDGHVINLQNFVYDIAKKRHPRLYRLTASAINDTTVVKTADQFLDTQYLRFANLLIMPCDDGSFVPSYSMLSEMDQSMFQDESGRAAQSQIRLTDLISSASLIFDFAQEASGSTKDVIAGAIGPSPESPNAITGSALNGFVNGDLTAPPLTLYQRLRDGDSQRLTFFEFSRVLYGSRISPGTLCLSDANISGSDGAFSVTLRDDGNGNLFRCDSTGSHASWSSCGHVFYDEGLAVIKSPHLWRFGQKQFYASWQGERPIYVAKYDAFAPAQAVNSSSNSSYQELLPSQNSSEPAESNVYIAGTVWLDSKMNVVMRAKLAQPALKRAGSTVTIRHRIDY